MNLMDLTSGKFVVHLFSTGLGDIDIQKELIQGKVSFIVVMNGNRVGQVFNTLDFQQAALQREDTCCLGNIGAGEVFSTIEERASLDSLQKLKGNLAVVVDKTNSPLGIIPHLGALKYCLNDYLCHHNRLVSDLLEYKKIVECLEEEIFVTDEEGNVLLLNPHAEKICGVKASDMVGKNVTDLEKEKIFSSSTTTEVLRTGEKVNMMQKLKSGKIVLATGIPVFNEQGEVSRVLSTSKDVKEINHLINELENKDIELARKNQELTTLREELFDQVQFISSSKVMDVVKETISKVAPTDLTILIQGESGVGKEVVTKAIHRLSNRNKHPFIKINCGLIPENLLESELFGYEGGAFTGASKNGKIGKIELANCGTLFLDEIGEMPLNLQVKLLEFLQDREIVRVGGTTKIKIDTRVIVATNRNLQQMVNERKFRQDLFYRLNVIPINIAPLRERIEDIPSLAKYFLNKCNAKYKMDKQFAPEVMVAFYCYNWPGNVRELEHVIERLVVTSDSDTITPAHLTGIISVKSHHEGKVICTDLIPLRTAKKEVEKQLVKKAYSIYRSTYKVGEVLQIDQSTVVKILKKYR